MEQISEQQRHYRAMRAEYAEASARLWRRIEELEEEALEGGWREQDSLSKRLLLLYRMVAEVDSTLGRIARWC